MIPSTVMGPMVAIGLYSTHADPRIMLQTMVICMESPQLGGTYRRTRRCSNVFRCCQADRCSQSSLVSSSNSKAMARMFFVITPLIARGTCSLSVHELLKTPHGASWMHASIEVPSLGSLNCHIAKTRLQHLRCIECRRRFADPC